ncbi:MAG: hypothetical protein HFG54_10410 [Lachnospiraceae bacterium]|nr:hypothetical protein [Lachnospiraceae bacterium]
MRKSIGVAAIILTVAALAGCSSKNSESDSIMDFYAETEWKAPDPVVGKKPRILFVGNSHTFYNDLTGTFAKIAYAFGHKSDVYELSKGYYTLKRYANPEDELGALFDEAMVGGKWDFVILQENSSLAFSPDADEEMFPYARTLDEKVKAAGGQTAFLMTWAPKEGLKDGFKKTSREELQSRMAENYMTISKELDDLLIPAGISFMRCADQYPEIELWDTDGSHPSEVGSYLAACTAYAVVFQQSPENCTYTGNLDKEEAMKLQKIAAELVLN